MAIKTQGTKLYGIAADGTTVIGVCATNISVGSATNDEIDTTDLCSEAKEYLSGLPESPDVSFTIQFDPAQAGHTKLWDLKQAGTVTGWALGLSDGKADPTVSTGELTLPTTRTWISFLGFVKDFPFDFQGNSVVTSQLTVKVSGGFELTVKE